MYQMTFYCESWDCSKKLLEARTVGFPYFGSRTRLGLARPLYGKKNGPFDPFSLKP